MRVSANVVLASIQCGAENSCCRILRKYVGEQKYGQHEKLIESKGAMQGRYLPIFRAGEGDWEEIEFWMGQEVDNGKKGGNPFDRWSKWVDMWPFCKLKVKAPQRQS